MTLQLTAIDTAIGCLEKGIPTAQIISMLRNVLNHRETKIVDDLHRVMTELRDFDDDNHLQPQIDMIEKVIMKIQALRCETTAQLDHL